MKRIHNNLDTLRRRLGWTPLRVAARLTIACLLLSFFGSSRLAATVWANGPTTVSIAPASQEIFLGGTGTTGILVEDVTDLYGFEFEITFDPTILEVVDADPDEEGVQIQPGDFLSPDWTLDNTVDNDKGTITYALCQMNPSPPQSGGGVLAIITWRGKAPGTSSLHLAHVLLGALGGVEIPSSAGDGQIVVVSAQAPPAATPMGTAAPTGTPTPPPPTSTPTSTPAPPTFTPSATAVLEATEPPAATPTSVPPGTATSTDGPTPVSAPTSTPVPTATPVAEGTGTFVPAEIAVQPTSTSISTATPQPVPAEGEALLTPLTPTPISPSGSSGISAGSLVRIALVCLFAGTLLLGASLGAWTLWRKQ